MRRISLVGLATAALAALTAPAAPAATFTTNGTTATFAAAPGEANAMMFTSLSATRMRVDVSDTNPLTTIGPLCSQVDADTVDCDGTRLVVNAGDNEDSVGAFGLASQRAVLNGGDDADSLTGGQLDDQINGQAGEDIHFAGGGGFAFFPSGADRIDGGAGDDQFPLTDAGDEVIGGSGVDLASYMASRGVPIPGPVNVSYTLDDQADDGAGGEGVNVHSDVEGIVGAITAGQENPGAIFFPLTGYTGPAPPEGSATVRGTDGPNTVVGGTGADDLDGGLGNDVYSGGDGGDTLRSADGFADSVRCGPGADTANADTLDVVSDSCETVNRTDVGNANDVPEVPEDAPPAVQFTSPASGRVTSGRTVLTADATDDRAVASVLFIDDDQIVCTDTAAPFTCDYQPNGGDVGRNTVSAMAVDSAQQTATTQRVFSVPRFRPTGISLRVSPGSDDEFPLRFRSRGRIDVPPALGGTNGCRGAFVAIQVKAGRRTISTRRTRVRPDCTFSRSVTFRIRSRLRGADRLRFRAVFSGNSILLARSSRVRSVGTG